jgi:hypothetical protein
VNGSVFGLSTYEAGKEELDLDPDLVGQEAVNITVEENIFN